MIQKLYRRFFNPNIATPIHGKIEVFVRHCTFSSISQHKKRFPHFSHQKCHENLLNTIDLEECNLTFFLDSAKGGRDSHFLLQQKSQFPIVEVQEGTEAGSFLKLLEYVSSLPLHPDTVLYFLEDDYVHKPGWVKILKEGFLVPYADYVTLYDHKDKYFDPAYRKLQSHLFTTPSCHWRSTPSTTQTFAVKFKNLLRDLKIHQKFSLHRSISQDHQKFLYLQRQGSYLISSIPGFSTHAEPSFASPCIDWGLFLSF